MTYTLHHGDCLEVLPTLPAQSVDAIIADPPYGTTACKWDSVIPLEPMWAELKRVIKPRGAIVLFAAQPFTSALVMSNAEWFKYQWIWEKSIISGFLDANRRPLLDFEEKPVALLTYLIRTCTNEGETVLDFTMGSGTTGVAAIREGRRFVGIVLDAGYFDIAQRRIGEAVADMTFGLFAEAAD